MRIYEAEKADGIDIQMNQAGSSTAFVTAQAKIYDIKTYFDGVSAVDLAKTLSTVQTVEELLGQKQPDLALIVAILVSTGWNLNDDIFTPEEVWKAKSSPLHKPMNDNHDAEKIIGHIVRSRALNKDGEEITSIDDRPNEFDIEVAGVLYRAFPELSDRIDEILAKAKTGDIFVSMEAWFPDFAYGIIDPKTGETKVIDRNETTAFLTKHLRVHGGSGQYQGFKIGRVLKNIIFGAQGFVDEPANPESVIKVAANKVAASRVFVNADLNELPEGGVGSMDKELQTKLDEALKTLSGKEKMIAELQDVAKDFASKNYEGQIAEMTEKIDKLTESVTEASERADTADAAKTELQKQLDDAVSIAAKSVDELYSIRRAEVARDRFAKLSDVKVIEDKEATMAELRDMTEETFAIVLKYAGETKSDETVDQEAKATDTTVTQGDESEATKAILDNVKEDDSPDFTVNQSVEKSEAAIWASTATALCGRTEEKE